MMPSTIDIAQKDLFTNQDELLKRYTPQVVERLLRLRDLYNWMLAYPETPDKDVVGQHSKKFGLAMSVAYSDLGVIKVLLPNLSRNTRDFHRWRFNEMILETYKMAKARKDTKTMERAATSYAKNNRVDIEDEVEVPYELILVQPFTATSDPSVLGIKPIPDIDKRIDDMLTKYSMENMDIEDVEFEEVDVMTPSYVEKR